MNTLLTEAKYLLRRIWRTWVHRRIHPSLVTPPTAASAAFAAEFERHLAGCDWRPHPDYSVFTQYDARYYTSLHDQYLRKYRCFWAVSRTIRPRRIIELGTNAGSGADAYLSATPGAEYIGIDQFGASARDERTGAPWDAHVIAQALLGARGFNYRLVRADLRGLSTLPASADLVVVDAAHDVENEYADLRLALTANPGWIFVDDAADHKSAGTAIARFLERDLGDRLDYTVPIRYIDCGLVIRLKVPTRT